MENAKLEKFKGKNRCRKSTDSQVTRQDLKCHCRSLFQKEIERQKISFCSDFKKEDREKK